MKISYYTQLGAPKKEKLEVSNLLLRASFNPDLVHQVVRVQAARLRRPGAHAKGRAEVAGSGRKPWPQKHTGRARHGSRRSPIWVGGGVVFGPTKERSLKLKVPKAMKRRALASVLAQKLKDKELLVLEDFSIKEPKTKIFKQTLEQFFDKVLGKSAKESAKGRSVLILIPEPRADLIRASRNLPKVQVMPVNDLNMLAVLRYKYLLITKGALEKLEARILNQSAK
jgi:large subunit ribosomal protein L4